MNQVFEFIVRYWKYISIAIVIIIEVLIILIKKKPVKVIDGVKSAILASLPDYIAEAEAKFGKGKGEEKLKYVVAKCLLDLKNAQPELDCSLYIDLIQDAVESILKTPQKKGELK